MAKARRFIAVFLAALVLLAVMTSLFTISHEGEHDCIGENCPVCAVLALCRNTLKALLGVFTAAAIGLACFCFAALLPSHTQSISYHETPISLKVKLLN